MGHKGVLSSKFNMSLGFIPVIISILLYEFITQDISIYIGAGIGILYSAYTLWGRGNQLPHFLLYGTTGMLLLLAISTLFYGNCCPALMFPLTLEISAIIPAFIFYLNRKFSLNRQIAQAHRCCKQRISQGAISAIVSTRVVLIIASIHFLIIGIIALIANPLSDATQNILFRICPPSVFILSILFNQFGIHFFNRLMAHNAFVPIVNMNGDVIGRSLAADAINHKNTYINPVIRIAISYNNLLFLQPRASQCILDKGKTDLPLETYLLYGETLEQGINRLLQEAFGKTKVGNLQFNIMYHFENEKTNRLIYLFILEICDENILHEGDFRGGKLWTLQQIEHNLNKDFFRNCLENEYEHLKEVICTREKYREF